MADSTYRIIKNPNGHYYAQKRAKTFIYEGGKERPIMEWREEAALPNCSNDDEAVRALQEYIDTNKPKVVAHLDERGNRVIA